MEAEQKHERAKRAGCDLIRDETTQQHGHAFRKRHTETAVVRLKGLTAAGQRRDAVEVLADYRARERFRELELGKRIRREDLHAHGFKHPVANHHGHAQQQPLPLHGGKRVGKVLAFAGEHQVANQHAEGENAQHHVQEATLHMGTFHSRLGRDLVQEIGL